MHGAALTMTDRRASWRRRS